MKSLKKFLLIMGFLFSINSIYAQQMFVIQNMAFGAFYPTSGTATINISPTGVRTISGGAISVGAFNYCQTIVSFTARKGKANTLVHITYDATTYLYSGTHSMKVNIGPSDKPNDTYTTLPNQTVNIKIGGTLTINNITLNPPGNYSGSFLITIIQE